MYENRQFVIFNFNELDKIDFSQVLESSVETVRRSVDGKKTFVKWDNIEPDFISNLTTIQGIYTYSEMLIILSSEEWIKNDLL